MPQSLPEIPPASGWSRRACLALLKQLGWRTVLVPLPGPKGVIMVYPHTSNWDFPIGMLFRHGVDLRAQWMGKHSLFRWPFGVLLRRLGGIAIERHARHGVTAAIVDLYRQRSELWIAIAPEGTRARVEYLKSGFYRIALEAGVPCAIGFIDYATRTVGIDAYVTFTGDEAQDLERLRACYAGKRGHRPNLAGGIAFRQR